VQVLPIHGTTSSASMSDVGSSSISNSSASDSGETSSDTSTSNASISSASASSVSDSSGTDMSNCGDLSDDQISKDTARGHNLSDGQTSALKKHFPSVHRQVVWELCCSPQSLITTCALVLGLAAERLTLETGWDFTKPEHGARACRAAQRSNVRKAWLALPCTPWSCIQNLNQRTAKQRIRLCKQRHEARHMAEIALTVLAQVVKQGGDIYFEWPSRCQGWKIPELVRFVDNVTNGGRCIYKCHVHGCAYNLTTRSGKAHLRKRWTILTTDKEMFQRLARKCPGGHTHSAIQGSETSRSAFYPLEMAAMVAVVWARAP